MTLIDAVNSPASSSSPAPVVTLVLGMHRSGTSALTRIINLLGAQLPGNLIPQSQANEAGFWESQDIVNLDDQLLAALGSQWDDWRGCALDQLPPAQLEDFAEQARALLQPMLGEARSAVLKDPRFCRLLPFWQERISELGAQVNAVLPLRHPLEVADSLRQRNAIELPQACIIWLRHVLDAERYSRELPRLFLRYEQLLGAPDSLLDPLAQFLGVSLNAEQRAAIEASLQSDLRHHVHDESELDQHPQVAEWVRSGWRLMLALCAGEDSPPLRRKLNALRKELERADAALGPLFSAQRSALQQLTAREHELDTQVRKQREQLRSLGDRDQAQGQELARRRARIEALESRLGDQEKELGRRRQRIENLQQQSQDLSAQLSRAQHASEQQKAQLHQRQAQIDRLNRELHGQRQQLEQARHQRTAMNSSLAYLRASNLKRAQQRIEHCLGAFAAGPGRPPLRLHGQLIGPRRQRQLRREAAQLLVSHGFDARWYVTAHGQIDCQGAHPVWHYLLLGREQGLQPTPLFDARWYLRRYPDLQQAGVDPLLHYIQSGQREHRECGPLHRQISAWLDADWYLEQNPDVAASGLEPLHHYLLYGGFEGRDPGPYFDSDVYLARYPDVVASGLNPLQHYLIHGAREGRSPPQPPLAGDSKLRFTPGPGLVDPASPAGQALQPRDPHLRAAQAQLADTSPAQFSIIMPTWNRGRVIARAIDSVLRQSYPHWQLIICDDGSSDGTRVDVHTRYADAIADGRIRYLSLPHGGVSAARNAGLAEARGKWIAYLDSDNCWDPNALLLLAAAFRKTGLSCAYGSLEVHDEASGRHLIRHREFDHAVLRQGNYIDLNIFSHTRELYQALGGFDEALTRLVDWDLILRYTEAHPPALIPQILAQYFISPALENITLTAPLETNAQAVKNKISRCTATK